MLRKFLQRKFSSFQNGHTLADRMLCFHDRDTNHMSYAIHLEEQKEMIVIDPLEVHIPEYLKFMEKHELKFSACFVTTEPSHFQDFYKDLQHIDKAFTENFKIYSNFENSDFEAETLGSIEPIELNELCFCYLPSKGFKEKENSILSVTHVAPNSTKIPVLFPGLAIGLGSVGDFDDVEGMLEDLRLVDSFSPETMIFPKLNELRSNIDWIGILDPENPAIGHFLKFFEENELMIGTSLQQEKIYNPFFRLGDEHFGELFGEEDYGVRLQKLKKFELMYKQGMLG
jgi:hypothetical protein